MENAYDKILSERIQNIKLHFHTDYNCIKVSHAHSRGLGNVQHTAGPAAPPGTPSVSPSPQ